MGTPRQRALEGAGGFRGIGARLRIAARGLTAAALVAVPAGYAAAQVVISEIHYDEAAGEQEFVEVYATATTTLTNWRITDQEQISFIFATTNATFRPCTTPFVLNAGDRLLLYNGAGTNECTGPIRKLYMNRTAQFLQNTGDDVVLRNATNGCQDYMQYEVSNNTRPSGCLWTGPNPSNGNVLGTSISRFDDQPDTHLGSDWERSGATRTAGPKTPGLPNISDLDGDGISDSADNCPSVPNPSQLNSDADTLGDACDNCPSASNESQQNSDTDTRGDACDNCPLVSNEAQSNGDADTLGDACDNCPLVSNETQSNSDTDGFGDACDNCPLASNETQENSDADSPGDACDNCPLVSNETQSNADADGLGDVCDNCDSVANQSQQNSDTDSWGDSCDNCPAADNESQIDGDGDGAGNACDSCPAIANGSQQDWDDDGVGDACDLCPLAADPGQGDGDGDAVGDACDNCPLLANEPQRDRDRNGVGDSCEPCVPNLVTDPDGDGVCASTDNCPSVANAAQADADADGRGDACEGVYYLVARSFFKLLPGGPVFMWGFAEDGDGDLGTYGTETPTSPGPVIAGPAPDGSITIHLRNELSEPVSLVIPGLFAPLDPTWVDPQGAFVSTGSRPAGNHTARVRSFAAETAAFGGTHTYVWSGVDAGTYLYQSGTHPAVQVQMGLYGAVAVEDAPGFAYPGVSYDNELILLYSEIDPELHTAIESGTYGPARREGPRRARRLHSNLDDGTFQPRAYPSPIQYQARYYLINGEPYPGAAPIARHRIHSTERVLLRFLSAALESHVPTIPAPYWTLVGEDGSKLPYPKEQYSVFLPAGKTMDAVLSQPSPEIRPLFDRRLGLANGVLTPGGMLTHLVIAP